MNPKTGALDRSRVAPSSDRVGTGRRPRVGSLFQNIRSSKPRSMVAHLSALRQGGAFRVPRGGRFTGAKAF